MGKCYPTGVFQTQSGKVLGKLRGIIIHYTVGQCKGLDITTQKTLYVCEIQAESNTVILGNREDLFSRTAIISNFHWIYNEISYFTFHYLTQMRSRQQEQTATVYSQGIDDGRSVFDTPQRAIISGQAAVQYDGEIVLGIGEIQRVGDT